MPLTDELQKSASRTWERAVRHPFVLELGAGTLPIEKFKRYFLQDYVFVDELRRVTGLAVAKAREIESARQCGAFLAVLLGAEDALFTRAFRSLGVSPAEYRAVTPLPVTRAFGDYLVRLGYEGTFEEICCALYVTEGVYLDWARRLRREGARPAVAMYEEWIEIHDAAALGPFVAFLKGVVDSGTYGAAGRRRMTDIFTTALGHEVSFWDMAYDDAVMPASVGEQR